MTGAYPAHLLSGLKRNLAAADARGKKRRSVRRKTLRSGGRVSRSLGRLGRAMDTHHFKEIVNGGVLFINPSTGYNNSTGVGAFLGTGVWAMQLTDFPIFQRFATCFEFVRLNKCTIEYIPKYNMQFGTISVTGVPAAFQSSTTGTLVTAIDQIPFNVEIGTTSTALNWSNDNSNSSGTTPAAPYTSPTITTGYVRGIQNSREKELYKKHTVSFMPAFYDYVLTGVGGIGSIGENASFERKVKKWVTTGTAGTSGDATVISTTGPVYYGPVYAFDINSYLGVSTDNIPIPLYDVRFRYSMSFKRLRGV